MPTQRCQARSAVLVPQTALAICEPAHIPAMKPPDTWSRIYSKPTGVTLDVARRIPSRREYPYIKAQN